ncbi:MAG: LamG domain-containing protein, partial [Sedimentisphaerales bacterium]|nr:LamG domain-containing protein [Sedimentisphaerales bacterium]
MCRKLLYLIAVSLVLALGVDGQAAELAHRWSFNGDLTDSAGGQDAVIVDMGASNAILSDTEITLTGGGKGTSDYIDLADGIVSSLGDAVTFEAWATQISVQNWSRIFDFGTSTTENVFMSWTSATTLDADRVEWVGPSDSDTLDNTNAPYTLGVEFHIVCVFDNGLVTWYTGPADSDTLGEAKGSFQSTNKLSELNDTNNWLGRSQWEDSTANASWNEVRLWKGALTPDEIEKYHRMGPDGINPNIAVAPSPADGATDVPREVSLGWDAGESAATHDVYLGTSFADVDAASRGNALGVLVSQGQAGTTYTPPVRLEFETTYYWRIDEVNAAPDNTVFKGEVWSFTTEPFTYPVANIIATSNAPNVEAETGPENTVNGSGLDADGKHSIQATDMWLAAGSGEPVWLQCEFDSVYKIHEMRVWNYNVMFELMLGFGFKDTTVEYSTDGETWTALG